MNIVVLIKDVPDITRINAASWNNEKGTLKRSTLPSRINPLDNKALALALDLKREWPLVNGSINVMSMGPGSALNTLKRAMATGCDRAVLLKDSAFAGSDTLATSKILAQGVIKLRDQFFPEEDYLVICGMQSIDGDTAQVPAQLAEELKLPLVPYINGLEKEEGNYYLRTIQERGEGRAALSASSALLTLADYHHQPYPSFHLYRKSLKGEGLYLWNRQDLGLEKDRTGLKASGTQVVRVFQQEGQGGRHCRYLDHPSKLDLHQILSQKEEKSSFQASPGLLEDLPALKGPLWIWLESNQDSFHKASLQLLGKALSLAAERNTSVEILCYQPSEEALKKVFLPGVSKAYRLISQECCTASDIAHSLAEMAKQHNPEVFLFAATPSGRILAPATASLMEGGLTADCTRLEWAREGKYKGQLIQTRPALGGNIMASIVSREGHCTMATVRPGVFPLPERTSSGEAPVEEILIHSRKSGWKIQESWTIEKSMNLSEASIILSVGAGVKSGKDLEKYIRPLAEELGRVYGKEVILCGSRRAVERNLIEASVQIGQTGSTVAPHLYIAVGISGAVQHLAGIEQSFQILALNRDSAAPIFKYADYGLIGDYQQWIPQWLTVLKGMKSYE